MRDSTFSDFIFNRTLSGFKYSFVDENIEDLNITEVAQQWTENRNVVREIYNSSFEGALQAIRKAEMRILSKFNVKHCFSQVQTKGDSMMTGIRNILTLSFCPTLSCIQQFK